MNKRQQVEKVILEEIRNLTKDDFNVNLYKDLFKGMNNNEFHDFMVNLKSNILNIITSTDIKESKITVENNIKILKRFNRPLTQHLFRGPTDNSPKRKTINKSGIYILPFRRTKQTIDKGVSIAEDNKHIDVITGQVSGVSRSSKVSNSELQLLISMDLHKTAIELNQFRGDADTSSLMISGIKKYGTITSDMVEQYAKQTKSSRTLKSYFNSMHLKIDL